MSHRFGIVCVLVTGCSTPASDTVDANVTPVDVVSLDDDGVPSPSDVSVSDVLETEDAADALATDAVEGSTSEVVEDVATLPDEISLGTVAQVGECPIGAGVASQGYTCVTLEVSCPELDPLAVDLIISQPAVEQVGVAVLGSGSGGTSFYNTTLMQELTERGFRVVNRMWHGEWTTGTAGMVGSACRYATLTTWIRNQSWSTGPLCASGNSGGSAEIAYVLSHWERGDVIDLAVLSGGPPMSRFDLACPSDSPWVTACEDVVPEVICGGVVNCAYNEGNFALIDSAFEGTPCTDGQPLALLREHSVLSEDARVSFPETALHFVQGNEDCTSASPQGYLYSNAIESEVTVEVATAPHGVFSTPDGVARLASAFEAGCTCRHASCAPNPAESP